MPIITVYSFSTDDDDGTQCEVFATEAEADQAAWDWCLERCDEDDLFKRKGVDPEEVDDLSEKLKGLYPAWTDLYELKGEYLDTCNTGSHEIWLPDKPVHAILSQTESAIASLMGQIEQMKGLFDDADGTIAAALQDGEDAQEMIETVKNGMVATIVDTLQQIKTIDDELTATEESPDGDTYNQVFELLRPYLPGKVRERIQQDDPGSLLPHGAHNRLVSVLGNILLHSGNSADKWADYQINFCARQIHDSIEIACLVFRKGGE